jgi:Uncharacterized protein conserved in bacteria (DUF2255)
MGWVDGGDLRVARPAPIPDAPRSAGGPSNGWFRRAREAGVGRISAGGVERSVTFEPASADVREAVDAAYHAKYDRYGPAPVGAVTGPDVLETTLRVRPR